MKTLLTIAMLTAASWAHADEKLLKGGYVLVTKEKVACDANDTKSTVPLNQVKVTWEPGENMAIVSSCRILKALEDCEPKAGIFLYERISTNTYYVPYFVSGFICTKSVLE